MSGHWPRGIAPSADGAFSLFLVDSGQKTGIKRGFRALRSASQGSALRTRKPFEKGLSESFH